MITAAKYTIDDFLKKVNNHEIENNTVLIVVYPWGRDLSNIMSTLGEIEMNSECIHDIRTFLFDSHMDRDKTLELRNTFFTKEIANDMARFVIETATTLTDCHFVIIEEALTPKSEAILTALIENVCTDIEEYVPELSKHTKEDMIDHQRIVELFTEALENEFDNAQKAAELGEIEQVTPRKLNENKTLRATTERVYNVLLENITDTDETVLPSKADMMRSCNCSLTALHRALLKLEVDGYIDQNGNILHPRDIEDTTLSELELKAEELIINFKKSGISCGEMLNTIEYYIEKVYNSELGEKRVEVMSDEEIEEYCLNTHNETSVVVSIRSTGGRKPFIKCGAYNNIRDVLFLQFDDVTIDTDNTNAMTDAQGDEIANFINKWKDNVDKIIFQCEYGESRSVGCASAVSEYMLNKKLPDEIRDNMNCLCYNNTYRALKRFSESE